MVTMWRTTSPRADLGRAPSAIEAWRGKSYSPAFSWRAAPVSWAAAMNSGRSGSRRPSLAGWRRSRAGWAPWRRITVVEAPPGAAGPGPEVEPQAGDDDRQQQQAQRRPSAGGHDRDAAAAGPGRRPSAAPGAGGPAHETFLRISEALVPPKPKLLDRAKSIFIGLALCGTRSIGGLDRGIVEVDRRRRDLVADRQHGEGRLDRAGRAQQVADRRLGRGHRRPCPPPGPAAARPRPVRSRRPAASRCRGR